MEGRMMLSVTGFDVPQPALDLTQFSFQPSEISLTSAYVTVAGGSTDGGYANANTDETSVVQLNHPDFATLGIGNQTLFYNSAGTSAYKSFGTFDFAITGGTFRLSSDTILESDGLYLAVITPWNDGATTLEPAIQPVVVGSSPSMPGVSEGGSIPIHAIFADFRQDSHLASGVKAISSRAGETSIDTLASARRLSAPDGAIAGEWARAMVFEIAGGEPTTGDSHSLEGQPTTTSDSDKTLQRSKPLSSVDTSQQYGKLASHHASVPANEGTPVGEPGQPQPAQPNGQFAAIEAQLMADGKLTDGLAAPGDDSRLSSYNPSGAENPNIAALATAAVFDQLGHANAAVIESAVDGKSWMRSIGTSPLLMVLALERIAAFNSRRATRESRIAAAKKPVRLRN
jgi:hypothetical protein